MEKEKAKGAAKMPDCEAKKKWDKENVLFVTTKLFKTNTADAEIIKYLDGKSRATVIKEALREYMANHPDD